MNASTPTTYELRVDGHLDDHWSSFLGNLVITHHGDGTSSLTGPLVDQTQLHGVLTALRDIGAALLSLQVTEPTEDSKPARSRASP